MDLIMAKLLEVVYKYGRGHFEGDGGQETQG
jgi:hypothetical protein